MSDKSQKNSVIILTYNRSDALSAVLYALCRQKEAADEIIITDDGSNKTHMKATIDLLNMQRWPFHLKYVWHPDVGFTASAARNQGVLHSSGDYIIFLDGDCVPRHGFIYSHLKLRRKGCFINGNRILLNPEMTDRVIHHPEIIHKTDLFWLGQKILGRANKWTPGLDRIPSFLRSASTSFQWNGIRSCNFSLWRDDFYRINGFDESFVGWGHEDADFVWRLHRAGCQRINGFWATEVLHLWHKEASRDQESANAQRLKQRMSDPNAGYVATKGIKETSYCDSELIFSN